MVLDATMSLVLAPVHPDGWEKIAIKDVMNGHGERTAHSNVNVPTVQNVTMSLEDVFVDSVSQASVAIVCVRRATLEQTACGVVHAVTLTAVTQLRVAACVILVGWELRVSKNVTWVRLVTVAVPSVAVPTEDHVIPVLVNVDADLDGSDPIVTNPARKVTTDTSAKKNVTARMLMDVITSQANVCALPAGEAPNAQKHAWQADMENVVTISVLVNTEYHVITLQDSAHAHLVSLDLVANIFAHMEDMVITAREHVHAVLTPNVIQEMENATVPRVSLDKDADKSANKERMDLIAS